MPLIAAGDLPLTTDPNDITHIVIMDGVDPKRITPADAAFGGGGAQFSQPAFVPATGEHLSPAGWGTVTTTALDTTTALAVLSVIHSHIFVPEDGTPIDALALAVQTAATDTGAAVRLAIHASDGVGGRPDSLIEEAGTATITTTGVKTITLPGGTRTLARGWVYGSVAFLTGGTTAGTNPLFSAYSTALIQPQAPSNMTHSASASRHWRGTITNGASFPANAAGVFMDSGSVPRVGLRVA